MLGWNILERNLTTGGLLGYSSLNSRVNLKVPSYKVIASRDEKYLKSLTSKGVS